MSSLTPPETLHKLEDYALPKTPYDTSKSHRFTKSPRRDIGFEASKKAHEPEPGKYSSSAQSTFKRYWQRASGKFFSSARDTAIDQAIKKSRILPGPGAYFKAKSQCKVPLGKFEY